MHYFTFTLSVLWIFVLLTGSMVAACTLAVQYSGGILMKIVSSSQCALKN